MTFDEKKAEIRKAIEELKIDNYYICDDFPKEWKNSTLRQLDLSDTRKQLIKKYSSFIKGDSSSWLYIFGNHKVGKSFIAVTFANEYIRLFKKNVAVVSTPNLFRYLSRLLSSLSYRVSIYSPLPIEISLRNDVLPTLTNGNKVKPYSTLYVSFKHMTKF